jgi:hypothetical protein
MTTPALNFAAAFAALYAAHEVGDHWPSTYYGAMHKGITTRQAREGGLSRWTGPRACAAHVATYTATAALFLAVMVWRTHLPLTVSRAALALAVSAVTHYWADRRYTLKWLCDRLAFIGKDAHYRLGHPRQGHDDNVTLGTGAFHLDQSFHIFWLFVAALICA